MPRAVKVITVELGVRFLADYLRGDTYFQLGTNDAPDLNKIRAMVQLKLAQQLA
jgi:N-acetylhexosamine 1-kinase